MRTYPNIQISASLFIFLAISLLLLPVQWVFAAGIAALIHELFHILAIKLVGCELCDVSIGTQGARISVSPMSPGKECICALAGPAGGLLLLLFARWIPMIAICAAIQSLYNLLPIYPMDGGRALRCILQLIVPKHAQMVSSLLETVCLVGITLIVAYAAFWLKLGILPLIFAGLLWYKTKNTPCKESLLRLQ